MKLKLVPAWSNIMNEKSIKNKITQSTLDLNAIIITNDAKHDYEWNYKRNWCGSVMYRECDWKRRTCNWIESKGIIDLSDKTRDQVPEEWKPLWRPSKKTRGTSIERMTRPRTAITKPLHRRFAGTPYDGTAPKPPLFIVIFFLFLQFFSIYLSISLSFFSLFSFFSLAFLLGCVLCFFCFLFFYLFIYYFLFEDNNK
jgi:hypothetical protein